MRLFRQDGDRHEFFAHCLTAIIAVVTQNPIAVASSITATLLLSPDVDQARSPYKSKALHRWKRLNLFWIWRLFRMLPGTHHRGITHSPIKGALVIIAWPIALLLLFVVALLMVTGMPVLSAIASSFSLLGWIGGILRDHWLSIICPAVAQQLVHLCLDR